MIRPVTALWAEAWRRACIAGLEWALSEIDPLNPDVPYIVHRLHFLKRQR